MAFTESDKRHTLIAKFRMLAIELDASATVTSP
jgi:hypothetical protein